MTDEQCIAIMAAILRDEYIDQDVVGIAFRLFRSVKRKYKLGADDEMMKEKGKKWDGKRWNQGYPHGLGKED